MTARSALVTGAGQGLGREIASRFAAEGIRVFALDIDGDAADRTAAAIGGTPLVCDVADASAVSAVAAGVDQLDILVNNAGIFRHGALTQANARDIDDVLAVNLLGTLHCVRAFSPALKAARGCIVSLSSVAAVTNSPEFGIYPVTKAAIEAMTRQLALELGPDGIRVNAVGPGFVRTEGTSDSYAGEASDRRTQAVPLRRLGTPSDIADVVSFLAGPLASYVTGQVIYADGGVSAGRPGG